ncbi:MAG: efflux RND transporter permease subunit [bacterium]
MKKLFNVKHHLVEFAINHPKFILRGSIVITLLFLTAFPSLKTDTDPVKMLPQDNPAIQLYNSVKSDFQIYDLVVLGIESTDGSSLFTPERLNRVDKITREILEIQLPEAGDSIFHQVFKSLQFLKDHEADADSGREIMVRNDVMALSTVDDIVRNQRQELELVPLMGKAPATQAMADDILHKINTNPILKGKLASEDGSLIGIFIPLKNGKKDQSYYLGEEMKKIANKYLNSGERYYLAGLPIAENTFGNAMFIQMGVYAPAAGLVIFLLLLFFFRSIQMVIAPMLLAMMTVTWSMGALIFSGESIHIMSSMIPIFLMPIAVLNSIHILSSLHEKLRDHADRASAVRAVMNKLFNPMLFTSITTVVGFVSLSTTGIPPVIVFGLTIGFGVSLAWLMSMLFIPAYFMNLKESSLKHFGKISDDKKSAVMEIVQVFRKLANRSPGAVILFSIVAVMISYMGVQKIIINDNPVRWFKQNHVLREADRVMNSKLAGVYQAHLVFTLPGAKAAPGKGAAAAKATDEFSEDAFADETAAQGPSIRDIEVIRYMDQVNEFLLDVKDKEGRPLVGGVTSIIDILKKVGDVALNDNSLPDSREKVSQYMFLFESGDSKKGKDMWKFITPGDGNKAQMWLQLKTGDNQKMTDLMNRFAEWQILHAPPTFTLANGNSVSLSVGWSGLTHINNVWQHEMVNGMRNALIGSFGIVFLMMVFLFRSIRWGVIAMLPLTLTIVLIYGVIGFTGKYYDMPIAVLSSLTLGLSIDFAIHFIESARTTFKTLHNVEATLKEMYQNTAQAIWRNVLVVSVGFMPLFFASLVPYVTVGLFFFAIMLVSGITTLILLPAIINKFCNRLPGMMSEPITI